MESDPNILVHLLSGGTEKIVSANPSAHEVVGNGEAVDNAGESHHTLPVLVTTAVNRVETTLVTESTSQINRNIVDNRIYRAVLDAIANISVSDSSGQAVAVALEMDVVKQVAVLTIAVNRDDVSNLVAYLGGLWRLLSIMSTRWETLRQGVDPTQNDASPSTEDVEPWRTEFIKRIYRHCSLNRRDSFERVVVGLRRFMRGWRASQDKILYPKIVDAVHSFRLIDTFLNRPYGAAMTDADWGDLICLMDGSVVDIQKLLDSCLCEEWAKSSQLNHAQHSYPLRSTLETLINRHRHIRNLLRFAHTPGSRPLLLSKMTIRVMPRNPNVPIVLPTSEFCWQSLIESVCGDNVIASYTWLDQQVTSYSNNNQSWHTVHGTCALIAYLETAHSTSQPPVSYIGVSSETCRACHTWIQAFNAVGDHQYSTRGTNDHWPALWAMPGIPSVTEWLQVKATLARLLTDIYADFWIAKGQLYRAGNIPYNIGGGVGSAPALNPVTRREQLIQTERERVHRSGW